MINLAMIKGFVGPCLYIAIGAAIFGGTLSTCATKAYYKGKVLEKEMEISSLKLSLEQKKVLEFERTLKVSSEVLNDYRTQLTGLTQTATDTIARIGAVRMCRPAPAASAVQVPSTPTGINAPTSVEFSRDLGEDIGKLLGQCERQAAQLKALQTWVVKVQEDIK